MDERPLGASSKGWSALYTRAQIEKLLDQWGITEPLPPARSSKKIVVSFPPGRDFRYAEIAGTTTKGTDGKNLYRLDLWRDAPPCA